MPGKSPFFGRPMNKMDALTRALEASRFAPDAGDPRAARQRAARQRAARGDRRVLRRRHSQQGLERYHSKLECRGRATVRLHVGRGARAMRHAAHSRGAPGRRAQNSGANSARRARRAIRDGAPAERRLPGRYITYRFTDQRFFWKGGWRIEDRARHLRAKTRRSGAGPAHARADGLARIYRSALSGQIDRRRLRGGARCDNPRSAAAARQSSCSTNRA